MIRCIAMIFVLILANPAAAQSVKLKAHEIAALLSGNTAVGNWEGTAYRQFFNPDGSTIYAQKGVRSTLGQWRIDAGRDEYQSLWPRDADWEGWYVMEYAGDFYWVSKSTPPTPFKVLDGAQLLDAQGQPASDQIRCSGITQWIEQSGLGALEPLTLGGQFAANMGVQCGRTLAMSGARSGHCAWAFPYRSTAAAQAFEDLSNLLAQCLEAPKSPKKKQTVNHPDSYEQRLFKSGQATVSLSLKDKGETQETYVFLRFAHALPKFKDPVD
ncbi:MAG: hypothetical protein WA790_21065 [Sulfitobacter sp.]